MALTKRACFLAVLLVLLFARSGRADDLFNNLSQVTVSSDPAGLGALADSFSTGTSSFEFDSLTLLLSNQLLDPGTSSAFGISPCSGASCGTTTVFLFSDSSSTPGTPGTEIAQIGSLNNSSLTVNPQPFTFATSETLDPDTRYWIEITSTDNNSWWAFSGGAGTGVAGEFTSTPGGVMANDAGAGTFQMEVSGVTLSSVPEPSVSSLLFMGLAALVFFAAIRRKCQVCEPL